jgi:hypothetical protein
VECGLAQQRIGLGQRNQSDRRRRNQAAEPMWLMFFDNLIRHKALTGADFKSTRQTSGGTA